MRPSQQEIEELRLLRDTFLRGEINEAAYARIRKAFIQTHGITEDITDEELFGNESTDKHASIELELLTTCTSGSRRARKELLRQQRDAQRSSFVANALREELRRSLGTNLPPLAVAASGRHAKNDLRLRTWGVVSSSLTVGFALAVTIFICRSAPVEKLITTLQPYEATAVGVPEVSQAYIKHFIRPLYGPVAVDQCIAECSSQPRQAQEACKRGCRKLSIGEYARRITVDEPNPKLDAQLIVARCSKAGSVELMPASREMWREELQSTLTALDSASTGAQLEDFGTTRLLYNTMFDANRNLTMPTGGSAEDESLTRSVVQATCLRANLALTELGILMSIESSDDYSRRYYSAVHKQLRPYTLDIENNTISRARMMGLIAHGKKSARG